MSAATLHFITRRVKTLVVEARQNPETCRMERGYMNRVFEYARVNREPELMAFVSEQEKLIV